MVNNINYIPTGPYVPITETTGKGNIGKASKANASANKVSFDDVLSKQTSEIKFSGHAKERLRTRNIDFNQQQLDRIASAVDRAASKGSKDSLLLVDNVAAVVSVENRTVITVVDEASMNQNVFTNIDSAVIA